MEQAHALCLLRAGKLRGAREFSLSAGLESFPEEILDLSDTLEVLSLSGNRLRDLPPGFSRLRDRCLSPIPSERPSAREILAGLGG